jgi:hypothetical protein
VVSGFEPEAVEARTDGAQAGAFGPNVLGQAKRGAARSPAGASISI